MWFVAFLLTLCLFSFLCMWVLWPFHFCIVLQYFGLNSLTGFGGVVVYKQSLISNRTPDGGAAMEVNSGEMQVTWKDDDHSTLCIVSTSL